MSAALLYGITGLMLFLLGLVALFTRQELLHRILAVNICGSGIFLLMISVAYNPDGDPDPVLHALVLTGIVITVSITGFALALAARAKEEEHRRDRDADRGEPGK
ncbi:cation:proton antiporter subunit C [Desulfurivibrio dismutans]|uniref:cation:proton antiporter subunit C n=1 Tax=Desulfurivibrio dismutans TaxID=1398908 RepID=UPI0023DB598A|nr:cation:proton antiporter subunit C [Desulfurivibrio alkaliphilus]MDF1615425.1 cation:proton antiporter subunit C [Desulfurivibrio alkaliphilus]